MVGTPYKVIRDGSLDDLIKVKARYKELRDRRYAVITMTKYMAMVDLEIIKRIEAGEKTLAQELFEITGNEFAIAESI